MEGPAVLCPDRPAPAKAADGTGAAGPHSWPGALLRRLASARWTERRCLVLLLAVALLLRLGLVWHTEVAARDSIGYIRYAWRLEHEPWARVLTETEQPPGYALALLGVSYPVRWLTSAPDVRVMQWSAQLTSALAGTLLVVPMFYLGSLLFSRRVGFGAALLFQVLPGTGRHLSDGLSEALFLLFVATALAAGARAFRTRSAAGFALAGLCGGLAYLTRAEGGLVVAATGVVLLAGQAYRPWQMPWRAAVVCGASLGLAAVLVAGPYVTVIGKLTNKRSAERLIEGAALPPAVTRGPTFAVVPALWYTGGEQERSQRLGWAWKALGVELARGSFQVGWVAALIGFWGCRGRLRTSPGLWVLLVVCAAMTLALWRLAVIMGYLSDRHAMLILFCGSFWAAAGLGLVGDWLAAWGSRLVASPDLVTGPVCSTLLLLAVAAAATPKTLETLHGNRAGHRPVGFWLRAHVEENDEIVDPYGWGHYYAGAVFREHRPTPGPPGHEPLCYAVLEEGKSEHTRLTRLKRARRVQELGTLVHRWAGKQGTQRAELLVYCCPGKLMPAEEE